jgi:hypothetical protein
MKSMTRRTVAGPFSAQDDGHGCWVLAGGDSAQTAIYLRFAGSVASQVLQDTNIQALDLQWRNEGVTVALLGAQNARYLTAKTAIIHEPRDGLYETLPLAGFDPKARQFWRRIFTLMRVPGGRFLLGIIARRRR